MNINGRKIILISAAKNITLSKLADMSGLSRQGLYRLIKKQSCYPITGYKIAKALKIPIETILQNEE